MATFSEEDLSIIPLANSAQVEAFSSTNDDLNDFVNGNPKFPSYGNENSPGLLKAFSVCYFEGFTPGSPGWTNP